MRIFEGAILLSASDMTRFVGCSHATALDLAFLKGEGPKPGEETEEAALLRSYGLAHEAAYLGQLKSQSREVLDLTGYGLREAWAATRDAMRQGVEVIYQGALLGPRWSGFADFIERIEPPSGSSSFTYEVTDTKLKRSVHPKHVLQLVLYSDLIADIQGAAPQSAHVELGDGERASLRLADYTHYARALRTRLEAFVDHPEPTRPVPCTDCSLCRWSAHCEGVWLKEDSLHQLAGVTRGQVSNLEATGIRTIAALAAQDGPLRGMAPRTLERLRAQARLQHARKSGEPRYELRPAQEGKGFALLPEPQAGDMFYDIEGDPHYPGGLEYLHGVRFDGAFCAFWAHDPAAEKQALIGLLELFAQRLAGFPKARIYHYASYEVTALKRLTCKFGTGEAFLDRLLRERRFVDLYSVVRSGLTCSEPSYSIKSLEVFYGLERAGEVKTAGGSVIAYERWRETGEQAILDEIEQYNRLDCLSTEQLRDWLVSIRPAGPRSVLAADAAERAASEDADAAALRERLARTSLPPDRQEQLFNLGCFHKREAKPAWWAVFDSLGKEDEELVDDLEALAGLIATGAARTVKRSVERTYAFPPQETKLRSGDAASVPTPEGFASVTVSALDPAERTASVRVGAGRAVLLRDQLTLHPGPPLDTEVIAAAVKDVITDQCGPRVYRAVDDLLSRVSPRLTETLPLGTSADPVAAAIAAIHAMDETLLPIQGPPGSGKTHVAARAILSLVRAGKRVGVTSSSHEAIRNVLLGCERALAGSDPSSAPDMIHKVSGPGAGYPENSLIRTTTDNAAAAAGRDIVGGTAFFFSRPENVQKFDWLFVDEAGQVGLASMAAIGRAARNIVLIGDPAQLPQVIQGAHPAPANLSCFKWVLGEADTVGEGQGLFLATTRRMHPLITRFISEQFYEGRLEAHPDTGHQAVLGTVWPEAGVHWAPVSHNRASQHSAEEVKAIVACCEDLLRGRWRDRDQRVRALEEKDIIVVAPYNAQVNALRAALPGGVRVGTVDRFQGQEAPVSIVSMTASTLEDAARGAEFLLSPNRLNVAISRAKALALVFGSPSLRHGPCGSVDHMKRLNVICGIPQL